MRLIRIFNRTLCKWLWITVKASVTIATFNGIGDCRTPPAHATPPPERFVPFSGLPPEMTRYRLPSVWAPPVETPLAWVPAREFVPFTVPGSGGDLGHATPVGGAPELAPPLSPPLDAPEPPGWWLFLGALAGMIAFGWRDRWRR